MNKASFQREEAPESQARLEPESSHSGAHSDGRESAEWGGFAWIAGIASAVARGKGCGRGAQALSFSSNPIYRGKKFAVTHKLALPHWQNEGEKR